jgi:crotonobetainyl-CoA:carnitine CoA-transferase CaiB-like acyl-CoA transferase
VEVGVWHAGPGVGAILADLGAEVIKVESPKGDPERYFAAFSALTDTTAVDTSEWTVMFELGNRGKRSISLDIQEPSGREIFDRLLERADVFVTNLRLQAKQSLRLDYSTIRNINERIIQLNMTGFGSLGPKANDGAFDNLGQAMAGMMFVTGAPDPHPINVLVLDHMAAITGSHAVITALLSRERHGFGQEVDTSLYGAGTWLMYGNLGFELARGPVSLNWDRRRRLPLRNAYQCRGGDWIVGTIHPEQKYWPTFCEALGVPDLAFNSQFETEQDRSAHLPDLYDALDAQFMLKTRDQWLLIFAQHGLHFAPIQRFADVLVDEQALVNGYVAEIEHPILGKTTMPNYPIRFSAAQVGPRGPAPMLGEHSREIAAELGYSPDEIELRIRSGVLKAGSVDD